MKSWFYVANGQRTGPVDEATFAGLVATGVVSAETSVWQEGMADWQPYRMVSGGTGQVVCSSCGKTVPGSEALNYGGRMICAECKPSFVQKLKEGGEAALEKMNYAGFGVRFGAKFVDGLIVMGVMGVIYAIMIPMMTSSARSGNNGMGMFVVFQVLIYGLSYVGVPLYSAFFLSKYGATPGKMACKLKVVRSDGQPLSFGRALGRVYAEFLSAMILYIGFIMVAFDSPERRALHDRICDTRVILVKK